MLRSILCSTILASSLALHASQASQAIQHRPERQIDYEALAKNFHERLPKELQGLVYEFLAHRDKKKQGTKDDFYLVSKEFLPVLLPNPCASAVKTITQRTALIHRHLIQANPECNYESSKKLTIIGRIPPMISPGGADVDWDALQHEEVALSALPSLCSEQRKKYLDENCAENHCYNKRNHEARKFIKQWNKKLCQSLFWARENLRNSDTFYCGYSDNKLIFTVLPIHKQIIDRLTLEQKQFLIDLYKAYEISNGRAHIVFDAQQLDIFRSFPQELQTKIFANYPIRLSQALRDHPQPLPQYEAQRSQPLPKITHRYSKAYVFLGVLAVAALSGWYIWEKVHRAKI